jgi:hypothetical protein
VFSVRNGGEVNSALSAPQNDLKYFIICNCALYLGVIENHNVSEAGSVSFFRTKTFSVGILVELVWTAQSARD